MQIFKYIYEFNKIVDKSITTTQYNQNIEEKQILIEWNILQKQLSENGEGVVVPTNFVNNIRKIAKHKNRGLFTGYAQNDMPEFMRFFIECIHTSIIRPINFKIKGSATTQIDNIAHDCYTMLKTIYTTEYSDILQVFYGIYISQITSINTNKICSNTPGHFSILDLPVIYNNVLSTTLYDCFDIYTKSEVLTGENAWFNEKIGKIEDITKRITFWNLPPILIITFNRFSTDFTTKINSRIQFPIDNLDLSKYVTGYDAHKYKYELFGICNHMGGLNGGHYNAFAKNADNYWLLYDDNTVTVVEHKPSIITQSAYCLFYRIIDNH
jgi:ubiquitin C-terminal hydrolase